MVKVLLWLFCMLFSGHVIASDVERLVERKGCFSCHDIKERGVGPSWSAVANKYRGQDDAGRKLVVSILYGSMGRWGGRPMRGQAKKIDKRQAALIAEFILGLD